MLATLTNCGRAAIARAIKERALHLAWGEGVSAWDSLPDDKLPSLMDRTSLFAEVGRRLPSRVSFAQPADDGDVVVPVGTLPDGSVEEARYTLCDTMTPYIYIRCNYDFSDAAETEIREIGLFMDTVIKDNMPPGQQYFTPEDIQNPGELLAMQIVKPRILRSPGVRQSIEFILPI